MISTVCGVKESIVARITCGWKKFRKLFPLHSLRTEGKFLLACVRREMIMMVRRNETLMDRKSSDKLRDYLGLVNIRNCIQRARLRWFRHLIFSVYFILLSVSSSPPSDSHFLFLVCLVQYTSTSDTI